VKGLQESKQALSRLLDEERRLLLHLEGLLDAEKAILLKDDSPEELEAACITRQECMGALLRLQDERSSLLRMLGYSPDNGLLSLIKACDPERALPSRWAECAELAKRCRSLNDHNGALVASRMRRIQGVLEIITGKRVDPNVYGKQAQQAWVTRGRMVAAEA
jgi:flagellar biosynthesis/type III secretory pathway chaperone